MAKIIGVFETLSGAQLAAQQLASNLVPESSLSIIGYAPQHPSKIEVINPKSGKKKSNLKKSLVWGSALGLATTFLLPGGGHLFVAGHLVRTAALHALRLKATGLLIGAVVGSTTDFLRQAGLTRRAAWETESILASGGYALALRSDWITTQRAREMLGTSQWQPDKSLVKFVERYGYEHQSFVSLYGGMKVWQAQSVEAAVVYRQSGQVAIVSAAPLTAKENLAEVTRQFLAFCKSHKMDCLMVPIGAEFATIAKECGMGLLGIGESGYFVLPDWKPKGDKCKKVRAGVNQARAAGVVVKKYDPLTDNNDMQRREIEALCQAWLGTREIDAMSWLLELDPFLLSEHKRYFLAEKAGRLEGLLACSPIPARNGWYLEDLIRRPDAERGVSELLVVTALEHLAIEGAELATLGTSPLAGIKAEGEYKHLAQILKLIYANLDHFYHFKDLHRFKAKFAPTYVEPEFLAFHPPRIKTRMVIAMASVFDPGGFGGLLTSKIRKLWREVNLKETKKNSQKVWF